MYINGCFEGGGIKGLAYVGAIKYLEERGYKFFKVVGTSVGALFASLIATGYNSYEIEKMVEKIDYHLIVNKNDVNKIIKNVGFNNIDRLENTLYEMFKEKNKMTFQDVKYGSDYLLKVVVTELKTRTRVVIPDDLPRYGYAKDSFLISKAVAMSCSIPIYYSLYKMNNNVFVDGGVVDNFPIDLLDKKYPIFGFKLSNVENKIVSGLKKKIFKLEKNIDFKDINIIKINTSFRSSEFKKGLDSKKVLYDLGYISTESFFLSKYS